MRIFKNAWFYRFARRERITDETLKDAVARAERGSMDANLGGGVIKQRIARRGQGKSGGYRTIIIFKSGDKAFFVYGFAKSRRENLLRQETETFKKLARRYLRVSDDQIKELIEDGELTEIK